MAVAAATGDHPVEAEQQHDAEHGAVKTTEVELVAVADADGTEQVEAEDRADDADDDRRDDPARIVTRHEQLAERAGHETEQQNSDDFHGVFLRREDVDLS
ncbi:MAG: hypothetical protein AVDCRST_MAG85-1344 [uncultured Solirubrobacteraceae bacterium]|uniref:Uncharacterized protein n=1 Tax=uncultured Solirubrobacteraceae bacterium TaxID=1162706 RepID=A0A6J4S9F3_9ACTN|nr:MAG: hypothetical protein AVDCRST_MAG85-1344 [uncultured Solirubrobacteraceae bacterium]